MYIKKVHINSVVASSISPNYPNYVSCWCSQKIWIKSMPNFSLKTKSTCDLELWRFTKGNEMYVHQFTLLQIIWEEESLHITSPSPWFSNPMNSRMKSVKISATFFQSWLLRSFLNKITPVSNREEKSLRRVAMVAKFLDDNKPKIDLKREFALFQTTTIFFTISFNLPKVGKIFWGESGRTVSEFRKKKTKIFVLSSPTPWRGRRKLGTFSSLSQSSLLKLPIVVIQKFCYHGNVTSYFSCLLVHMQGV